MKANVKLATQCVIISNPECSYMEDRSADATTLLALLNFQALAETNPFIMVEFVHTDVTNFLLYRISNL
jgi:hypothetical protein